MPDWPHAVLYVKYLRLRTITGAVAETLSSPAPNQPASTYTLAGKSLADISFENVMALDSQARFMQRKVQHKAI